LESYNLRGQLVQRISDEVPFWGNVDTRARVDVGGFNGNLVAVAHRGLQFYSVNPDTRRLVSVTEGSGGGTSGEGVCLYQDQRTQTTYAVVITIQGRLRQYVVTDEDGNGLLGKRLVRDIQVGSEAEGCVAHDDGGSLYVSEEDVALWRYGADPDAGTRRTVVDKVVAKGGGLSPDIEGVALAETADHGDFLLVSAQRVDQPAASYFLAYEGERDGTWTRHRAFRIVRGADADDCDRTDGVAAYAGDLGRAFPEGIFVCQENDNSTPGVGNQNLKFVRLESVLPVLSRG
jgi:myo-inositol-hexaphosphate 3-phosphohydrolase